MLEEKNKINPFKVPDNYFQNLNAEVMANLPERELQMTSKRVKMPIWKAISTWGAAAAVLLAVSVIGFNFLESDTTNSVSANLMNQESNATLENDYYLFLEDEAAQLAYQDAIFE